MNGSLMRAVKMASRRALAAMPNSNTIIYKVVGNTSYNTTTGAVSSPVLNGYQFQGWLTSFEDKLIDGTSIQPRDRRLTVRVEDLPAAPKMTDMVTTPDDGDYVIVNVKREITDTIYILHLRKP